jgi:hypothetical protein
MFRQQRLPAPVRPRSLAVALRDEEEFRRSPKGRFFNFVFNRFGQRLFDKYGNEIVASLEQRSGWSRKHLPIHSSFARNPPAR